MRRNKTCYPILFTALLCLSGCAASTADAAEQTMQPAEDTAPESEAALIEESAAVPPEAAQEAEAETEAEPGPPKYVLDRSNIPEAANVPVLNQKDNVTVTYEEVLDYVEQQAETNPVNVSDYQLSLAQLQDLTQRYTNGDLAWRYDLDGIEILWDAQTLDFSGHNLAALDVDMYQLFGLLESLEKVDMCKCGFSNDEMAALQDAFPEIKIVWEIVLSHWTIRTDVVAFSTMKTCDQTFFMSDDEAKYLKYCTDLVALDLGHNHVTDISFLQYMPELKILILVDNVKYWEGNKPHRLNDLSMLQYVPKLEYLEFFVGHVKDLSFLQYTPNIVDLNISYNPISDATYLFELPKLERLIMEHTKIPYSEFLRLKETYPNAQIEYYGEGSIDHNWRKHERYYAMRDMFKNNYVHPLFAD